MLDISDRSSPTLHSQEAKQAENELALSGVQRTDSPGNGYASSQTARRPAQHFPFSNLGRCCDQDGEAHKTSS